jgi:hypothetical protein
VLFLIAGCRYKDGPAFSVLSAKTRVTNTWVIQRYSDNGNDQTNNFNLLFPNYTLTIKDDNSYTIISNGIAPFNESGKWEFQENATKINFKKNNSGTNVLKITRLKIDELWANQTDIDGHLIEYRLRNK